ncbi:TPA: hypothetical protein ACHVAL_001788, partial [Streptococcus suis]
QIRCSFYSLFVYFYTILTPSKISKRENCARKGAALFNHEQTHPRFKKLGAFTNFIALPLPLSSASVVLGLRYN